MKGGEDKAVVPRLPRELNAGGVGDAGHRDAVAVLGGRTKGLGHLLFTHAPVGGHDGPAAQQERHDRLDEGEARGTHQLQERHRTGGWEDRCMVRVQTEKNGMLHPENKRSHVKSLTREYLQFLS